MTTSADPANTPPATLSRGRRYTARGLVVLGTIVAVFAIFAVWANRQVLNSSNWADTSSQMLENSAVRSQLSAYLVDQVYANVDVAGELQQALPPRLAPLAGPAANSLRDLATKTTDKVLDRPRVQESWKAANKLTAQQFINIAEGNSGAITSSGNAVVLDLRVMVLNLVKRLGLPGTAANKIPPGAGSVKVMSGDQVTSLQNAVTAVKGLSAVLPGLAILLFALAAFISPGRRRQALFHAGAGFVTAGLFVLIARIIAGNQVVDSLATTDAVKPAAQAAWDIGSGMLRDVAWATVILGLPLMGAAWLAGPRRPAVAARRAMAPTLRESPAVAYGVAGLVLVIIIAWGPLPATRMLLPVLLMIAATLSGVAVLRRQTATEFPDTPDAGSPRVATPNGSGVAASATRVRGEATSRFARRPAPPTKAQQLAELEKLAELHDRGVLSDEEFAAEKATILSTETVA